MTFEPKVRWVRKVAYFLISMIVPIPSQGEAQNASTVVVQLVSEGSEGVAVAAVQKLAVEVRGRTSIELAADPKRVTFEDPSVFDQPIIYWAGDRAFAPLSAAARANLRRFLEAGGFVLVDDLGGRGTSLFEQSVARELTAAFTGTSLRAVPPDHVMFRTFFLLPGGRGLNDVAEPIQMLELDGRAAVVLVRGGLGTELARPGIASALPHFAGMPSTGFLDPNREQSIRLAINLVMYAVCLDYKADQVHAPFIMRRRGVEAPGAPAQ